MTFTDVCADAEYTNQLHPMNMDAQAKRDYPGIDGLGSDSDDQSEPESVNGFDPGGAWFLNEVAVTTTTTAPSRVSGPLEPHTCSVLDEAPMAELRAPGCGAHVCVADEALGAPGAEAVDAGSKDESSLPNPTSITEIVRVK